MDEPTRGVSPLHARRIPPAERPRARAIGQAQPFDRRAHRAGATSAPPDAAPVEAAEPRAPAHPDDLRRTASALLSALIPGLGQLVNGRWRLAALLFLPVAAVAIVAAGILRTSEMTRLLAWVVDPSVLRVLLATSLVVLAVRVVSVLHAFFDRRYRSRPGPLALGVLALSLVVVAVPHGVVHWYGSAADAAFGRFFSGSGAAAASTFIAPRDDERLNVLVVGIDKTAERTATLTDTMMLVSLDRKLGAVSLVSIPRDLVDVPLGDGRSFAPKLNSLYSYAERNHDEFPAGGMRALEDAVGALLGVRVHGYAQLDFSAFVRVVDLAGGVDVKVQRAIDDPDYPGYDGGPRGFQLDVGRHHLDGVTALAYARSRKGLGDSDFTRAARQQEILVALKAKLTRSGSLFFQLPELLDIFGDTVRTDLPPSRLPQLAALADGMDATSVVRVVLQKPLVHGERRSPFGSVQVPNPQKIAAMAAAVLPPPGTAAMRWTSKGPVPLVSPSPAPSPSPAVSP